jgi:DNA-directed RNA polymerase specialized sigma24 family protein
MIHGLTLELLHQAQAGQEKALSTLSELVKERVYIFIYRLTLDQDCTEDLTQETLVELIRSLNRLSFSHINFFWAWLHRTALGKVQHFYRIQGNKRIRARNLVATDSKISAPRMTIPVSTI